MLGGVRGALRQLIVGGAVYSIIILLFFNQIFFSPTLCCI